MYVLSKARVIKLRKSYLYIERWEIWGFSWVYYTRYRQYVSKLILEDEP